MNSSNRPTNRPRLLLGVVLCALVIASACGEGQVTTSGSATTNHTTATATQPSNPVDTTSESQVSRVIRPGDQDSPVHIAVGWPDGILTLYAITCGGLAFTDLTVSQGAWFDILAGASPGSVGIDEPVDPRDPSIGEDIWAGSYLGDTSEVTAITWGSAEISDPPTLAEPPQGVIGVIVTAADPAEEDETQSMTAVLDLTKGESLEDGYVASTLGPDDTLVRTQEAACGPDEGASQPGSDRDTTSTTTP